MDIDTQARSSILRLEIQLAQVTEARLPTREGAMRKRHLEILLPSGWTYRAGDCIDVLPLNSPRVVQQVMERFRLLRDATMTIKPEANTSLPTGKMLSVHDMLAGMVDLGYAHRYSGRLSRCRVHVCRIPCSDDTNTSATIQHLIKSA
jgi:cytochrome P450/NADPH-cytochrome P450 reductase